MSGSSCPTSSGRAASTRTRSASRRCRAGQLHVRRRVVPVRRDRDPSPLRRARDGRGGAARVGSGRERGMTHHIAFAVDDLDAACARLAENGVVLAGGPMPRGDGYVQVFFLDPDGHVLELFEHTGTISATPRRGRRARGTSLAQPLPRVGTSRAACARSANGYGCRGARGRPSPWGCGVPRARR